MEVKVLYESGYEEALLGMSLSFYDHDIPLDEFWTDDKFVKASKRARKLAFKQGGHNKFLESIIICIYIKASRSFWSEFDTYRVGMTKQSSSTMHTLDKRPVTEDDFEIGTSEESIRAFNSYLLRYKDKEDSNYKNITYLKNNLPEGWLQERIITTNYKVLQNIIYQRKGHRLKYWNHFISTTLQNCGFPELLVENYYE